MAYHSQLKQMAGDIIADISDEPWGIREFTVAPPDGHTIMIGETIELAIKADQFLGLVTSVF